MKSLKKIFKFKIPHALALLFFIIVFFGFLSLVLSWAEVKTKNEKGEVLDIYGAGILQWISTIPLGLYDSVGISVFLFIFGSFMYVVIKTNALNAVILSFLKKININLKTELNVETKWYKKICLEIKNMFRTTWVIIPVMLFLSLNGTFNGMGTSSLPLYAFVVPIFLAAGFDIWSSFLVVFIGAGCGVMGSTVNPFATIISTDVVNKAIESETSTQEIISISDGMAWRWIIWIVLYLFSTFFVMIYTYRVKKNYQNSYFSDKFAYYKNEFKISAMKQNVVLTKRNLLITTLFFLSFFLMLFFVIPYDQITHSTTFSDIEEKTIFNDKFNSSWFNNSFVSKQMTNGPKFQFGAWNLTALSGWFLFCTVVISKLAKISQEKMIENFTAGCKHMIPAILCIGFASGLSVLFTATNLKYLFINGIIAGIENSAGDKSFTIPILTYILTIPVSLLIPSTSGLAKAIFPVLGPAIYEISGEEKTYLSGTITSYTLGIGLGNLFAPTYAAVICSTQFCQIKYTKFLKCIWKFLLFAFLLGLILIIFGVLVNKVAPADIPLTLF